MVISREIERSREINRSLLHEQTFVHTNLSYQITYRTIILVLSSASSASDHKIKLKQWVEVTVLCCFNENDSALAAEIALYRCRCHGAALCVQ